MIRLTHDLLLDDFQEFNEDHAYNLMSMKNNGGWKFFKKEDEKKLKKYSDAISKGTDTNDSGGTEGQGEDSGDNEA